MITLDLSPTNPNRLSLSTRSTSEPENEMDLGLSNVHVLITGHPPFSFFSFGRSWGLRFCRCKRGNRACHHSPISQSVSHPLRWRWIRKVNVIIAEQGARVSAQYRTNPTPLEPLLAEYGPERICSWKADVEYEDQVSQLFVQANSAFGPVQVVIVNHGYWPREDIPISRMTLRQWNSTISTDLTSCFLVCREFLRNLEQASDPAKEQASIVLIGSTAGKYGEGFHADYAAAKSGELISFLSP